jgi:hypothetical protein
MNSNAVRFRLPVEVFFIVFCGGPKVGARRWKGGQPPENVDERAAQIAADGSFP